MPGRSGSRETSAMISLSTRPRASRCSRVVADVQSPRRTTREALERLGVRPMRRLGQSFLVAPAVARRIVAVADVRGKTVVEVGPGLGALSDELAATASELVLVEVDRRLADRLRERYFGVPNVRVVNADALAVDFAALLDGRDDAVAIGNLPYSVGT